MILSSFTPWDKSTSMALRQEPPVAVEVSFLHTNLGQTAHQAWGQEAKRIVPQCPREAWRTSSIQFCPLPK